MPNLGTVEAAVASESLEAVSWEASGLLEANPAATKDMEAMKTIKMRRPLKDGLMMGLRVRND